MLVERAYFVCQVASFINRLLARSLTSDNTGNREEADDEMKMLYFLTGLKQVSFYICRLTFEAVAKVKACSGIDIHQN